MRFILAALLLLPGIGRAAEVDLGTMSCANYRTEMSSSAAPTLSADPINTMMWLFGFAVARSGAHVMYGGALAGFGFALDAECSNHPNESLLRAIAAVKPDSSNPMDLATLDCATFVSRHVDLTKSDAESANTLMMWLFGFSVATSGSQIFDTEGLAAFEPTLLTECGKHPDHSVFDALGAAKVSKVGK
jgi:hypothetical protein